MKNCLILTFDPNLRQTLTIENCRPTSGVEHQNRAIKVVGRPPGSSTKRSNSGPMPTSRAEHQADPSRQRADLSGRALIEP